MMNPVLTSHTYKIDSVPRSPEVDALLVVDVCKAYGSVEVLRNVNLQIAPGERVALMGRSGSGKSTLLNCICGIEPIGSGQIQIANLDLSQLNAAGLDRLRRETIGYVFQTFHLLPTLTALENVEFPAQLLGLPAKVRKHRAEMLLERVGMSHRKEHLPDALSGGERQRVALARAVINRPKLILADEPTGSLDSTSGERVLDLIEQLSVELGTAVLLVTHDPNSTRICDRVVHMQDGCVLDSAE